MKRVFETPGQVAETELQEHLPDTRRGYAQ
jgi:hypothetical protein